MKKSALLILLAAIGSSLFVAGQRYGQRLAASAQPGDSRRVLYYVDPMNPAHTSDKPGFAPCGMKLEPVYADADGADRAGSHEPVAKCCKAKAAAQLHLGTEKLQFAGVRVGSVGNIAGQRTLRGFGRVTPDDRRVYHLNAGVEGIIREVSQLTVGSAVKKGQWLGTFSAPDTRTTILGYLTAVDIVDRQIAAGATNPAQLSIVNENVRLGADRLQGLGIAPLQIQEITESRSVPTTLRMHSPADGTILASGVTPWLKFEKGMEWFRIADLTHVWVFTDVSVDDARNLAPGTGVEVSISGTSCRKSFAAKVSDALPQFDPVTRTLKLRLEVENPDLVLRPDMAVDVTLPMSQLPTLAVAADAVIQSGTTASVFVELAEGRFEPRKVATGRRIGDQVEILAGLEPGDRIATSGLFLLDSESRMKQAAAAHAESM